MNVVFLKEKIDREIKLHHLAALYRLMINNEDELNAKKILDLYKKQQKEEIMISFAGHFSAGKSSMINALLDDDILPKSPIPTSANIVRITSGGGYARVYFRHEQPIQYTEPYDIDRIKAYSKDKKAIKQIDISTSKKIIPPGCYIIDTPGIDAADDADRIMTEGSLHLVDIVFYVMDYNHVQSEVNLEFLKELQDKSIPYYVIVNQIDKHDEQELTFKAFQQSIEQTFKQWVVTPEQIFFSSLTDSNAEHNQFEAIKNKLFAFLNGKPRDIYTIGPSVKQIIAGHKRFLEEKYEEMEIEISDGEANSAPDTNHIEELNYQLSALLKEPAEVEEQFIEELNQTLKNAYLMPADLRDIAEAFLHSRQPDFKVGFLSSKRKTDEVRKNRMENFLTALQKNTETAIEWKLRDKFTNLLKVNKLSNTSLQQMVQKLRISLTNDSIMGKLKPGAKVNGEYVLNYTNEVANEIKSRYKREALHLIGRIKEQQVSANEQKIAEIEEKLNELKKAHSQHLRVENLRNNLYEKLDQLEKQLMLNEVEEATWEQIKKAVEDSNVTVKMAEENSLGFESTGENDKVAVVPTELNKQHKAMTTEKIIDNVEKVIQTIKDSPGFQGIVEDLQRKKEKLEDQSYTIALFGAFSAGKSSFANALLGEGVLPVSPNPTTATVNRINPVCEKYPHGSVVITVKNEETLKNDVKLITKNVSSKEGDFQELLEWIKQDNIQHHEKLGNLYQSYLRAMLAGYEDIKEYIGSTLTVSINEFATYVADEAKASFIESIDLYYDCSLTQQGITLVDTPGADSVNARHTNVAFDYIKYADAILYVTYYNHALARADKDFLTQLGRVKDTFQLDKMFFIVNAADLAENHTEINMVTNYVKEQLVQLGIRIPRLYPVSSKLALREKQNKSQLNEDMQFFENEFYQFIHQDLSALTAQSAIWDMKRAYTNMAHYKESVNMDQQSKESFRLQLQDKQKTVTKIIDKTDTTIQEDQLIQKIEKQLHYVLERTSIQFHDLFKETFNPTTITESGKDAKVQLWKSLEQLIGYVGHELLQELRAVSLRVEAMENNLAKEMYDDLIKTSNSIDDTLTFPKYEAADLATPVFSIAFESVDLQQFDKALSMFKNTKTFFAQNEKEKMKDKIYEQLEPLISSYLSENKSLMTRDYLSQWKELVTIIKREMKEQLQQHTNSYLEMMSSHVNIEIINQKLSTLTVILTNHDIRMDENEQK
ncbi:dynamin family GTPase [Virgibacillus halodenitrificans]|uniref:dynamin family protein n=1 Tax=Virgibacillus halodenitrificans TaxID=1482 RepID=UPI001F1A981D|nr:dynamin family protein [Virgibacillus halodenitrificans]MCG1028383.1 dynamin family GTPase [Virgibacillus halodenitrificans]